MHYIDPSTGENSALVACKYCNLQIIKFLNETCRVDFGLINKEEKNALHIAVSSKYAVQKFEVVVYLVEKCRVDITYRYKELLESTSNLDIACYFQKRFGKNGVALEKPLKLFIHEYSLETNGLISEKEDTDISAISSISAIELVNYITCLLYTSPSPRDRQKSRMPSSA